MDTTAVAAVTYWGCLYLIPLTIAKARGVTARDVLVFYWKRLLIVVAVAVFSSIMGFAMSGLTGQLGGFVGSFLSVSWIVMTYAASRGITPSQEAE